MFDCPKCVTVCKQPHCVTHCQAPKPECEPVCEEPKCDWKCHKPQCPKPKCELVCENPNCVPKAECCPCAMGTPRVSQPFPFFKETETNKSCCGCNPGATAEIPQVTGIDQGNFNTMPSSTFMNTGKQLMKIDNQASVEMLDKPVVVGTGQLTGVASPNSMEFQKYQPSMNMDLIMKDRRQ